MNEVWEKKERERRELEQRLEIIVTGMGHSAWGRFYVSGRVRCWDGMILLMKEYYVSRFVSSLPLFDASKTDLSPFPSPPSISSFFSLSLFLFTLLRV